MKDQSIDNTKQISHNIPLPLEVSIIELERLEEELTRLSLNQLKDLCKTLINGQKTNILARPLNLLEFEMLEAELRNQGILQKGRESISKNLEIELTHLKWSIREHLKNNEELELYIDVPNYLLKKTITNLDILNTFSTNVENTKLDEFKYFDQLAAYINGEYEEVSNSFEKGLNLVLKTIRSGTSLSDTNTNKFGNQIQITLPIDKKSLIKKISSLSN